MRATGFDEHGAPRDVTHPGEPFRSSPALGTAASLCRDAHCVRDLPRHRMQASRVLGYAVQATQASEAQVKGAEAAVYNARLNVGWTKVYSPIAGIAGIAPVQVGDLVTPSTVLTNVSQVDPMKVTFPITEREYLRYA